MGGGGGGGGGGSWEEIEDVFLFGTLNILVTVELAGGYSVLHKKIPSCVPRK